MKHSIHCVVCPHYAHVSAPTTQSLVNTRLIHCVVHPHYAHVSALTTQSLVNTRLIHCVMSPHYAHISAPTTQSLVNTRLIHCVVRPHYAHISAPTTQSLVNTRLIHCVVCPHYTHVSAPTTQSLVNRGDIRSRIWYQKLASVSWVCVTLSSTRFFWYKFLTPSRTQRTINLHAHDESCAVWLVDCVLKVSGNRNLQEVFNARILCQFLVSVADTRCFSMYHPYKHY